MASFISGTSIPQILSGAAVVEQGDSFVTIGGWTKASAISNIKTPVDKIYRYDATSGGWTELQTTISQGKWHLTAMKVESSTFDSCNSIK